MTKEQIKQLPVYLTETLHRRLRIAAAVEGQTMTAFCAKAIEKAVNDVETRTEGK